MSLLNNRLASLAALALGVVALASLGWQGFRFYRSQQNAAALVQLHTKTAVRRSAPKIDLARIQLFGTPAKNQSSEPVETRNLPKTNLQITLRGVMAGVGKTRTSALVEGPDKKTRAYHLGDTLPGNAKLKAVLADRIIISRNGHLENLFFPKLSDDKGVEVAATPPPDDNSVDDAAQDIVTDPSYGDEGGQSQPGYGLSARRKAQIQEKLRELRRRLQPHDQ